MDLLKSEFNARLFKIANEYQTRNISDFMLILDPAASGFTLPSLDYLSTTDCFHPSKKAHELFASYAWHNLFLPFKEKKLMTDLDIPSFEPTKDSFIRF